MPKNRAPVYDITLEQFVNHPAAQIAFPLVYAGYLYSSPDSPLHFLDADDLQMAMWQAGEIQTVLIQLALHLKETGRLTLVYGHPKQAARGEAVRDAVMTFIQEGIV